MSRLPGAVLLLALAATPAVAADVHLSAVVGPELMTVAGTVELHDADGLRLVDALGQLPMPEDDQVRRYTFPLGAEAGWVHITPPDASDACAFHAVLPRRYGASGMVPGHGLFANGLWHPQPMLGAHVPVLSWDVEIQLPPGTIGVLNGVVGEGTLHWTGQADRLALAVVPEGRVQVLEVPAGTVVLVDHGRPRPRRDAHLTQTLIDGWPGPGLPRLVVVETPSRRRLVRAGPHTLFLSDRAFRVSGPLWRFHVPAVRRGLLEAGLDIADPWQRQLAATALSDAGPPPPSPEDLLGWVSWIPEVDQLLYNGRLPFYSDVFDESWPGDTLSDDLLEFMDPHTPGRAVARKLDALYGSGTALHLAERLAGGVPLDQAVPQAGLPLEEILERRQPSTAEDLVLAVADGGTTVVVERRAPPDAPREPVVIEVNGSRRTWIAGPGPDRTDFQLSEPARSVRVDPEGLILEEDRANDQWPHRWTATLAAFPYEISLTQLQVSAFAQIALRQQFDTRWLYLVDVETSPEDTVSGEVAIVRYLGPLQDRQNRPLRLVLGAGPALLDPDYRPTADGALAVGGSAAVVWDTRVTDPLPSTGHRLSLAGSGGWVPGSGSAWSTLTTQAVLLAPVGGRVTSATRLRAGLASGAVEHRLLSLGGSENVQGLAADAVVGHARLVGASELRWQVLRHQSVPFLVAWLSDLQLSAGLDLGAVAGPRATGLDPDDPAWIAGWSAGLMGVFDVLGARPTPMGVWVAGPLTSGPEALAPPAFTPGNDGWLPFVPPQVYVRFWQPF